MLWPVGFLPKDSFSCSAGDGPELGQVQRRGDPWEGFWPSSRLGKDLSGGEDSGRAETLRM